MGYKDKAKQREYQKNWYKARRVEWIEENGGKCVQCGSTHQLEVDHINHETKVSHRVWSWTLEKRMVELAKCQLLCRSCHYKKTGSENFNATEHGTASMFGYRNGHKPCRCEKCREYKRIEDKKYREKKKLRKVTG